MKEDPTKMKQFMSDSEVEMHTEQLLDRAKATDELEEFGLRAIVIYAVDAEAITILLDQFKKEKTNAVHH